MHAENIAMRSTVLSIGIKSIVEYARIENAAGRKKKLDEPRIDRSKPRVTAIRLEQIAEDRALKSDCFFQRCAAMADAGG